MRMRLRTRKEKIWSPWVLPNSSRTKTNEAVNLQKPIPQFCAMRMMMMMITISYKFTIYKSIHWGINLRSTYLLDLVIPNVNLDIICYRKLDSMGFLNLGFIISASICVYERIFSFKSLSFFINLNEFLSLYVIHLSNLLIQIHLRHQRHCWLPYPI